MIKHELRALFLQKRAAISELEKTQLCDKIYTLFHRTLPDGIKTVHCYLPIKTKNEIDTWPIIRKLWTENVLVTVPVMLQADIQLSSALLTEDTQIKENVWGVKEPLIIKEIDSGSIDAIILPLLVFDAFGNRIGYGKGYYDAYLKTMRKDILKIGMSYFPPVDKKINVDPWDVPMDYCITPDRVFKF